MVKNMIEVPNQPYNMPVIMMKLSGKSTNFLDFADRLWIFLHVKSNFLIQ